ncbi:MAG: transcription termination factor Rho [Lachnospiraceae bacterium]|nr:transcription termination factor Rho [Lachnospiraceae bacterium]
MREKLQSFTLTQLKEIAKSAGLKGIASLKKEELIDRLVELDEKMQAQKAAEEKKAESKKAPEEKKSEHKKAASSEDSGDKKSGEKKSSGDKKASSGKPSHKKDAQKGDAPKKDAPAKAPENRQPAKNDGAQAQEGKPASENKPAAEAKPAQESAKKENVYNPQEGDEPANGILEVMPEGYGFIRCDNYLPGENDVYVSPAQIRKFGLRTGDVLDGVKKAKSPTEKFSPLIFLNEVNGYPLSEAMKRVAFENMTPIFPNSRIRMETDDEKNIAMRVMDLVSPVGKGQRGMIVSPPKAGKTTLLKSVAQSILYHNPDMHIIILLIDERPEEVTDMKEAIKGKHVEVIYSTFDEMPEHHARVSEMVIERARRLVEHGEDVVILLDSITRLARAYNQVIPPSGRTLSGGLDPAALHMPKRFFGAARNMREGGSLTILATALVETGSKMDDVVYEEFKGTGNMEMILDRKLSEKRIFPAVDLAKSGTRREDLLLTKEELRAMEIARRALNGLKSDDAADRLLEEFKNTRSNAELVRNINVRNHV